MVPKIFGYSSLIRNSTDVNVTTFYVTAGKSTTVHRIPSNTTAANVTVNNTTAANVTAYNSTAGKSASSNVKAPVMPRVQFQVSENFPRG